MAGDYSRFTDDARKRFSRVLMQQGRVQLDSDWNELVEIITRRDRTQMFDIMGPAAVPRATTPDAFKLAAAGNDLTIGAGRMYLQGVLAEAFGDDQDLLYSKQPFWPDPPPLNTLPAGPGLVYLDVWDRELTSIEEPRLLEPALGGIDTTTRTQTVWQVRVLTGSGLDCSSDFSKLLPPSSVRLTVKVDPPMDPDPCLPPESGGVEDVENRFYRVEVHASSPAIKFKFYRDPVVTRVEAINGTRVTVERIGLDSVLRFLPGQWVELTSDRRYLDGQAGLMAKIVSVDEAKREIELDRAIAASETSAEFPARLIRWDQQDGVDGDGLLTATGAFQPLERGIQVQLTAGSASVGDYWNFPSRVAGRTAGPLDDAAPLPEHHYAALAMVTGLGGTAVSVTSDCRHLWPESQAGEDCECAVCVSPEQHNSGALTIQQAVDLAKSRGGGKVCLKPGAPYIVRETIRITDASSLSLTGHGASIILFVGQGPVIAVETSGDIVIEDLGIARGPASANENDAAAVLIRDCLFDVTVRDCLLIVADEKGASGVAVLLDGLVNNPRVLENVVLAPVAVANDLSLMVPKGGVAPPPAKLDVILGLDVRENLFITQRGAVHLLAAGVSGTIAENGILSTDDVAIFLFGLTVPAQSVTVDRNLIATSAGGIFVTTSNTRVTNNTITGAAEPNPADESVAGSTNIAIAAGGFLEVPLSDAWIVGNRISNIQGNAVFLFGHLEDVLIKQNSLRQIGGGGIVFAPDASALRISIENNELVSVALRPPFGEAGERVAAGIALPLLADAQVSHNSISGLGSAASGIASVGPVRLRLIGNAIDMLAAAPTGAGIHVFSFGALLEIASNSINGANVLQESGSWSALRVLKGPSRVFGNPDLPDGGGVVITGNTCRNVGRSSEPLVSVTSLDSVQFADNFCTSMLNDTADSIASVAGRTAIVTSNRVAGKAKIALRIGATLGDRWTVLGNISDFGITINGSALTAPWLQLNRT